MVHINLPPEPPAAEVITVATPVSQSDSASLPDGLLDELLISESTVEPSFARSLAQHTLLTQQPASEQLPTLPAAENTPTENTPAENTPAENAPIEDAPLPPEPETSPTDPQPSGGLASELNLSADTQEFDPNSQTITARGNVLLRLNDAIIRADELWVNLVNRYALAEGDVLLTRGAQIVRGRRLEYNFIQQSGVVEEAVGTIYFPDIETDFSSPLQDDSRGDIRRDGVASGRRAYDPVGRQPDFRVESDGSLQFGTRLSTQPPDDDEDIDANDDDENQDSVLNQLRFETGRLSFDVDGWRADEVRITNDPFSPPELELRANGLLLRNVSPTQDELLLRRPRLVFDDGLSIPLLRSRIRLSRGRLNTEDLNPVPTPIGIDSSDRGGLYLGRKVPLITSEKIRLNLTPQLFVARAFSGENGSPVSLRNFGATADFNAQLTPRTTVDANADITSFDLPELSENLRASVSANQLIGDHQLSLQYIYRERLFNGSLGFQDVQSSLGLLLVSPTYQLGDTGLKFSYQASAQIINAETDRPFLIAVDDSDTDRITAVRYQGSAALRRTFGLWRGQPKPPTQSQGLRYTPAPVVPYLDLNAGVRTTLTNYSTGDNQNSLIADIGLEAQLGHFARDFGDYTRLNVAYSQSFVGEADSPFLFDRQVDRNVLSLGIVQQIYGPFLAGFQTALSFDGGEPINTIYSLEYSRRTYGLLLRYDTTQEVGSIGFRLSNFSWIGGTDPFDTPRIRRVEGGVVELR